jgi:sugar/nucleoside kinase (ribokinase family)
MNRITGGKLHVKINIGGPSIVSQINVAQIFGSDKCEVRFYECGGKDNNGQYLLSSLKRTPVIIQDYKHNDKPTPSTCVLSDPSYNNGLRKRIFINSIGAACDYSPEDLDEGFFSSNIVVFGGTALVPKIHDNLTSILKKAKSKGCITILNTVFDFRNEKANPATRWPLGESDESYRHIDLLISDKEEECRLSGENDSLEALKFFKDKKLSSLIITNGPEDILTFSNGSFFSTTGLKKMPVSGKIKNEIKRVRTGDTTG